MQNNDEKRSMEIIRWLSNHSSIEHALYRESGNEISDIIEIIKELKNKGLYELIYLLLKKNECDYSIEKATRHVITECMIDYWDKVGTENMCQLIIDSLKKEMNSEKSI